jgi:hypothetical protein
MLAGTAGARSVIVNFSPPTGGGFFCPVPGCAADGTLPPAGTPCPIFSYSDNAWGGTNIDAVKIYNMTVNWAPATPTATITATPDVAAAAFDASYNASWNDCVQPGTTQKFDGIGGVIMYRAQWKTWASVCPNQTGVNFTTPAVTGVTQLWAVPTGASITAGQSTTSMTCTWGTVAGSVTVRSVNSCGQSAARSKSVTLLTCMEEEGGIPLEQRMSELNVYPNPNDGSFTVRSAQAGKYRLLSSTGQMIYEIQLNETNNFSFEVNGLSTGFYFLQGISGSSYVQQKVVVTNR